MKNSKNVEVSLNFCHKGEFDFVLPVNQHFNFSALLAPKYPGAPPAPPPPKKPTDQAVKGSGGGGEKEREREAEVGRRRRRRRPCGLAPPTSNL